MEVTEMTRCRRMGRGEREKRGNMRKVRGEGKEKEGKEEWRKR